MLLNLFNNFVNKLPRMDINRYLESMKKKSRKGNENAHKVGRGRCQRVGVKGVEVVITVISVTTNSFPAITVI